MDDMTCCDQQGNLQHCWGCLGTGALGRKLDTDRLCRSSRVRTWSPGLGTSVMAGAYLTNRTHIGADGASTSCIVSGPIRALGIMTNYNPFSSWRNPDRGTGCEKQQGPQWVSHPDPFPVRAALGCEGGT